MGAGLIFLLKLYFPYSIVVEIDFFKFSHVLSVILSSTVFLIVKIYLKKTKHYLYNNSCFHNYLTEVFIETLQFYKGNFKKKQNCIVCIYFYIIEGVSIFFKFIKINLLTFKLYDYEKNYFFIFRAYKFCDSLCTANE